MSEKEQMSIFLADAGCSDRMKEINMFGEVVFSTRSTVLFLELHLFG